MTHLLAAALTLLSPLALATTPNCENSTEQLRQLNMTIFSDKTPDVDKSPQIHEARTLVKQCQINLRKLGLTDTIYNQALEKNRREEIKRQEYILNLYSHSGKVDAKLAAYKEYLSESKDLSPARTAKFIKKIQRQAMQSFAEESKTCSDVDLRDKTGPVYNQGVDGWCYAFTVANMVSARIGQQVSAAGVAFAYGDNDFYDFLRYVGVTEDLITNIGFTTLAFSKAQEKGFCRERDLPSEGFKGIYTNVPLAALDRLGKKALRNEIAREEFITKARALFPNLSKEQFVEVLKKGNRATYLNSLVSLNCASRIRADDLEMTSFTKTDNKKFGAKIDELLTQKNPVELGYNADFFIHAFEPTSTVYHSSLLVGRRLNSKTGQCEYLLKNSYGKDWRPESPEFEAADGYAWIPKSRMIEATRNISYIK